MPAALASGQTPGGAAHDGKDDPAAETLGEPHRGDSCQLTAGDRRDGSRSQLDGGDRRGASGVSSPTANAAATGASSAAAIGAAATGVSSTPGTDDSDESSRLSADQHVREPIRQRNSSCDDAGP